jgi:hypothetical protein
MVKFSFEPIQRTSIGVRPAAATYTKPRAKGGSKGPQAALCGGGKHPGSTRSPAPLADRILFA